jgi:hypothetical protein
LRRPSSARAAAERHVAAGDALREHDHVRLDGEALVASQVPRRPNPQITLSIAEQHAAAPPRGQLERRAVRQVAERLVRLERRQRRAIASAISSRPWPTWQCQGLADPSR